MLFLAVARSIPAKGDAAHSGRGYSAKPFAHIPIGNLSGHG